MSTQLIEEYNQIVGTYSSQIQEINDRVHEELKRRRIMYGGEVARTFLRPSLLTTRQFATLENACNVLINSVNTILDKVFEGSIQKMGSSLGIPAEELELTVLDPGYKLQVAINRMDAFVIDDSLTFLEFNCDSPAGIAYSDELADVLRTTPFLPGVRAPPSGAVSLGQAVAAPGLPQHLQGVRRHRRDADRDRGLEGHCHQPRVRHVPGVLPRQRHSLHHR